MCMPGEDGCKREPLIGNGCEPWDVACNAQFAIDSAMRDMATQITEAVRKALASVGSLLDRENIGLFLIGFSIWMEGVCCE